MDTRWEKEGRGMTWDVGTDVYTYIYTLLILCIKQMTNENLVYSTGNSVLCGDLDGKEIQEEGTHVYM